MPSIFVGKLARVVDDIADDTSKVAMSLGVVEVSELGGSLVQARVGRYSVRQYFDVDVDFKVVRGTD